MLLYKYPYPDGESARHTAPGRWIIKGCSDVRSGPHDLAGGVFSCGKAVVH